MVDDLFKQAKVKFEVEQYKTAIALYSHAIGVEELGRAIADKLGYFWCPVSTYYIQLKRFV
jgi:hypothetical protein